MEPVRTGQMPCVMGGDAHYLAQPQWSRPSDDAAVHGARRRYEAAMEPLTIGWTTGDRADDLQVFDLAAMEPAEDRLDDLHAAAVGVHVQHAAMEPAEERPDDQAIEGQRDGRRDPAMEPTGDRPEDAIELPDYQIGPTPQWSRPRIGWVTFPALLPPAVHRGAAMEPAYDRLGTR